MKVLVIGLDGASMEVIKRWAWDGKLPTFKKLMNEGSYGDLESVIPTLTIPAWNCLASGKNPGKLGWYGFIQKVYGSYDFRFPLFLVKKEIDIWDILSGNKKEVFVVNAPNVQYSHAINGYMVAGPFNISEKNTYPSGLKEVLDKIGYEEDIADLFTVNSLSDENLSKKLKEITDSHLRSLDYFLEKKWDFGFFVLSELDRAQHRLWDKEDMILEHYHNIDTKLGELLSKIENDNINIFIVSDHGFGPAKRIFLVNEWLIKNGYLELQNTTTSKLINSFGQIFRKLNLSSLVRLIINFPGLNTLYVRLNLRAEKINAIWNKTKAFSYAGYGQIYINLKGREPQGIVEKEEYESLRDRIIEELKEISVKAYRREELYQGEYLKIAPDIIVQTDDYVSAISARVGYGKEFLDDFGFPGYHRIEGTFIAWGPAIKENSEKNAKMYDIAPTILHMFGVPIPDDMDGRVLKEIFNGDLGLQDIKYLELDEKKRIKKKIRELKSRV